EHERGCRRLLEAHVVGQLHDVLLADHDVLCIRAPEVLAEDAAAKTAVVLPGQAELTLAAAYRPVDHHAVAHGDLCHALADRADHPRAVRAGDVGVLELDAGPAVPYEDVKPVERGGVKPHLHLAVARLRRGKLAHL